MTPFFTPVLGAAALALLLLAGTAQTPDHFNEWEESGALKELQDSEAGTVRREAAGQALCNEARGPNSQAGWTADGDLVCTTRRGNRRVSL